MKDAAMLPDRAAIYQTAPLDDLLALLLRQYRRPLYTRGVEFTDAQAGEIARALVNRTDPGDKARAMCVALTELVAESERVLAKWNLTFQTAIDTPMEQITGWETTSDFLEIANEKSNAELRISTGSILLAAMEDYHRLPILLFLAARPERDIDTILARRLLAHISGVDEAAPDWLDQVSEWTKVVSG
jgi:hypothetical protein